LELVVAVPVLELRAVEIRPAVEDAGGQVRDVEQLDFDLVQPSGLVAGLDVDDAEPESRTLCTIPGARGELCILSP
jgi:hypothetical protein